MSKKANIILSAAAAVAGGAAFGVKTLKKNNICPICEVKKAIASTQVHVKAVSDYNNGVALTPPMGWSSWNTFKNKINENLIFDTAVAMKESGLLDAGYQYVNIDDCWEGSTRDENGRLQNDFSTFPSGMKALVDRVNSLGLKLGIYSSNGTKTCEGRLGTLGHERVDAETFADWGIEYFKFDFCHHKAIPTEAPFIDKIIIENKEIGFSLTLQAEDAELYGMAKIIDDSALDSGKMVVGLCNNKGAIQFSNVEIPEGAEYVVTVYIRKGKECDKYLEVIFNNKDKYPLLFEACSNYNVFTMMQFKAKLDKGNTTVRLENPFGSDMDTYATQYINMGKELKRATENYAKANNTSEKPIVYSICEWGLNKPWQWGKQAGNLWRTTPDIKPVWASVLGIYEVNVRLYKHSCVGGYNDPDMLEVGNGKLSMDENIAHFSLWCMMASPLVLGNDLRKFLNSDGTVDTNNKVLEIVTNKDAIAIDQDKRCIQCKRIKTDGIHDVLVKPLENGELALCLFNKGFKEKDMSINISSLLNETMVDLPKSPNYHCKDVWSKEEFVTNNKITACVPSHGVKLFRIKAI